MSGVALVGYSGSLIKDTIKESVVHNLARALGLHHGPPQTMTEEPEVTKVLVGEFFQPTSNSHSGLNVPLFPSRHILRSICASIVSVHTYRSPSGDDMSYATRT